MCRFTRGTQLKKKLLAIEILQRLNVGVVFIRLQVAPNRQLIERRLDLRHFRWMSGEEQLTVDLRGTQVEYKLGLGDGERFDDCPIKLCLFGRQIRKTLPMVFLRSRIWFLIRQLRGLRGNRLTSLRMINHHGNILFDVVWNNHRSERAPLQW